MSACRWPPVANAAAMTYAIGGFVVIGVTAENQQQVFAGDQQ